MTEQRPEKKVIVIPAKEETLQEQAKKRNLRVAAYCRVSTNSDEQLSSYENQKAFYTEKIMKNPDWTMTDIFADEGKTGNLIMYHIFHVPTVELHDELYGYLQAESNCWYENNFDNWLLEKNKEIRKTKFWIPMKNGQVLQKKNVTLQQYVRNSIHHPENDKNPTYTQAELQQSIEQMLDIVEHLPL